MRVTAKYSATHRHASVAGDMLVSHKGHGFSRECKVAPRIKWFYSSLAEVHSVKDVFFISHLQEEFKCC